MFYISKNYDNDWNIFKNVPLNLEKKTDTGVVRNSELFIIVKTWRFIRDNKTCFKDKRTKEKSEYRSTKWRVFWLVD